VSLGPKLRILRKCVRDRRWRPARWIIRTLAMSVLWSFCAKCGRFGWFGGSSCCWTCQWEKLKYALFEADEALESPAQRREGEGR
jgi:hypothetical protein